MSPLAEISRKVCLVGDFAVGKTSLVRRFVTNVFSESYLTTVGVKIDTKEVDTSVGRVKLIIWDLAGAARFDSVRASYLRGSHGLILVADGTRATTLDAVLGQLKTLSDAGTAPPHLLLINKVDLRSNWEIEEKQIAELKRRYRSVLTTSAKSGEQVEQAFMQLTEMMVSTE